MPTNIESDCTPEQLEIMIGRIQSYWEGIGEEEAFWSVLTNDKYRAENLDAHLVEFYESGATVASQALSRLSEPEGARGLELGCGTGRITTHLADKFKAFVACDISRPHLEAARKHLKKQGADVCFRNILNPDDLLTLGTFDFIFSVITLQHNPPPVIRRYIRIFGEILRKGGVAYFQVPTEISGYTFAVDDYLRREKLVMEMHMLPSEVVNTVAAEAGCEVAERFEQDMVGSDTVRSEVFVLRKR